ncbi:amidase family protein [Nocardioides sp. SOB77]|uniref:Amidase family protein n=1 Tax=Nocardioides oceani TaxID=3058369 RepID=A0ABT8FBG0_9ACTN|nr:amidase family protein [Nocardioides oceani]MDN4171522.1 amidase family protein [Nocardioides oceani]
MSTLPRRSRLRQHSRLVRVAGAAAVAASLSTTALLAPTAATGAAPAPTTAVAAASPTTLPGGLELSTASIEDLQAGLTAGAFTSVDLVEAYLARIDAINYHGPRLNAVRQLSSTALAQAEAADRARAAGQAEGPLFGIPILVKDNIDVAGLPTTAGNVALANSYPAADAPLAASLEEAGAIILGKLNLTEFANYMTSGMPAGYSSLGGQVLNAYDLSQTPSGSSAGSGVAASTAMAAATVGTETSGSILSPSNANSLVGIKPTVGLISRTGVIPISASQDTAGPMTRSVYDAAAVLTGLTTGADPEDPATQDEVSETYDDVDYTASIDDTALTGVRLGYIASTNETYLAALDVLRAQGAELVEVTAPANTTAPGILTYEFRRDLNAYLSRLPADAPMTSLADIIEYNSEHAAVALKFGQTLLTASQDVDLADPATAAAYEAAREQGLTETRAAIDAVLESNDVEAIVSNAGTTGIGARAGYPSLTLPAGYTPANRRPVAITFLGAPYTEQKLIGFASDYEAAADVWRAPEEINPTAFACTPLAHPDSAASCDEPTEVDTPARSVTLATLVREQVRTGQRGKVRVAVAAGSTVPTGRVRVTERGATVGSVRLNGAGRGVVTLKPLGVGKHRLVVTYVGKAGVRASSDKVTLTVRKRR